MTEIPTFIYDFCAPPLRLSPLAGGLSNDNFQLCLARGNTELRFFVRQFGALYHDLANNPAHEYAAQQQAAAQGLAPAIQYHCQQGLISDWVEGQHWNSVQQAQPANVIRLAKLVASLHQLAAPSYELDMQARLSLYYGQIQAQYKTQALQRQWRLVQDIIEQQLAPHRRGFCHHDMNPLNFMATSQGGLYLLDWEYAASGHCDFDIATLFQTFAWEEAEQALFLSHYNAYFVGAEVTAAHITCMAVVVEMMTLLWCILMYQRHQSQVYYPLWQQSKQSIEFKISKLMNL